MKYQRKTKDTYELHGYYCGSWSFLLSEDTFKDAKDQLNSYKENEHGYYRIVKKRIKIF